MPKVTWVPRDYAVKIKEPLNIISISGMYDNTPAFAVPPKNLLSLRFNPFGCGMDTHLADGETCRKIFAFMETCKGEDILVHCGEGRIRSPAVALFIADAYDRIDSPEGGAWEPDFDHPGRKFGDGSMDLELMRLLHREWETYQAEKQPAA